MRGIPTSLTASASPLSSRFLASTVAYRRASLGIRSLYCADKYRGSTSEQSLSDALSFAEQLLTQTTDQLKQRKSHILTVRMTSHTGHTLADVSQDKAAQQGPTTPEEKQTKESLLMFHWCSLAMSRCSKSTARKYQARIANVLIPLKNNKCTTFVDRRGAKCYVDFLTQHRLKPQCAAEYSRLRELLTYDRSAATAPLITRLPLFPSGVGQDEGLALLSRTTTWKGLYAILEWNEIFLKEGTHVSSKDIMEVLLRFLQEEGLREEVTSFISEEEEEAVLASSVSGLSHAQQDILNLILEKLQLSRSRERVNPALAGAAGVDRTLEVGTAVKGLRVVAGRLRHAKDYHATLLSGDWRTVLDAVLHSLHPNADMLVTTSFTDAKTLSAIQDGFSMNTSPQLVPLFAHPKRLLQMRLPTDVTTSPMTPQEERILLDPPTRGLLILRHDQRQKEILNEIIDAEVKGGRSLNTAPTFLVELRRRLWCLAQLQPHISRSLVEFNKGGGGFSGNTKPMPAVRRSLAKETLPWLLVAAVGSAIEELTMSDSSPSSSSSSIITNSLEGTYKRCENFLCELRGAVLPTLFTPHECYASFHEHLLTSLQLTAASMCVSVTGGKLEDIQHVEKVCHMAITAFMCPPSPQQLLDMLSKTTYGTDEELNGMRIVEEGWQLLLKSHKDADTHLLDEGEQQRTLRLNSRVLHVLSRDDWLPLYETPWSFFSQQARSMRNYYVSLYWEALSQSATLEEFLGAMQEETAAYGPPVLAPESLAAVLTSLTLRLLPKVQEDVVASTRTTLSDDDKNSSATAAVRTLLREAFGGILYFVVPADKAHAISSYLKGVHPGNEFFSSLVPDDGFVAFPWRSAAALLGGRSLRRQGPYPTSTTDCFFRVNVNCRRRDDDESGKTVTSVTLDDCRPPDLRLRIIRVDVCSVVEHMAAMQHEMNNNSNTGRQSLLLAHGKDLPFGIHALYKQAGTNTTLHAGYPSLIPFMMQFVPWQGQRCPQRKQEEEVHRRNPEWWATPAINEMPIAHQHGLINRIDVGTSGIVLTTDSLENMHRARHATLVQRRMKKKYLALVQHIGPRSGGSISMHYLPPRGLINCEVLAHGGDVGRLHALADLPASGGRTPSSSSAVGGGAPLFHKPLSASMHDRRPALTRYRVLDYFSDYDVFLVEVELVSGRRHQIRQHMAMMCCPLLGDDRYHPAYYGGSNAPPPRRRKKKGPSRGREALPFLDRPALHAASVSITGDDASEGVTVSCEMPADMKRVLQFLRTQAERQ